MVLKSTLMHVHVHVHALQVSCAHMPTSPHSSVKIQRGDFGVGSCTATNGIRFRALVIIRGSCLVLSFVGRRENLVRLYATGMGALPSEEHPL